jgi:type II secretory pathway pseudopilin PulG
MNRWLSCWRSSSRRVFTLLEVVCAIGILAFGLTAALGLSTAAANRIELAAARRDRRHRMIQAAEYYLLAGPKAAIPEEFFPFPGWNATCTVEEPEDLPEGVEPQFGPWRLVRMRIVVTDNTGKEAEELVVEKIVKEFDL